VSSGRLAIVCSGQAGQRRDMLDPLLADPELKPLREAASEVLGEDLAAWWRGLDESAIFANANAQFAIAFYQLAVWHRIKPLLPDPTIVAGYSLGELVAYHVAGAADPSELLRLARLRASLMDDAGAGLATSGGCMLLWRGRTSPTILAARDRSLGDNGLDLAIVRRHGEQVYAGPADAIDRLLADPAIDNPDLVRLAVSTPSHSRYLSAAAAAFQTALSESALASPAVPVLAGVSGRRVRTRDQAIDALSSQIRSTLRWDTCMSALVEAGVDTVIELGPGNDLAKIIETDHPRISARSVDDFCDWRSLSGWLTSRCR
jgi:[acyl-carrier-protein] S-malonyltransferase